jgi:hypothetical protein
MNLHETIRYRIFDQEVNSGLLLESAKGSVSFEE